jgi:hypothetical protein
LMGTQETGVRQMTAIGQATTVRNVENCGTLTGLKE